MKVGFTVNKLLLIGSIGLLLGACSTVTNTEEDQEKPTKETVVKTVDAVEETEEGGIVADEITTTFYPEVTELRQFTEEDLEWYDIIMTRLNAIDDFSGDWETVYEIAKEYGEDPEELWVNWLEIVNAKMHENNGDFAILPNDNHKLTTEILEKNIVAEKVEYSSVEYALDEKNLTTYVIHRLHIDGEPFRIAYEIEHRDDFKVAEIIEFSVNGKKIDL